MEILDAAVVAWSGLILNLTDANSSSTSAIMQDTVGPLSPGDRIGNYEVLGLVGMGGMGVVYKARDTTLERVVALKLLPPHLRFSEKDRKRLLQEARSASSLDHPNIGVIYGIEETADGQSFIVMAFYEGKTLADRIATGPMEPGEAMEVFAQIVRGVSEAHSHNVIHRDIKPSNIIITKQNLVKIVDFGLALVLSDPSATRSLGNPGTAVYMAPEQVQGGPADQRSDIWALGVMLAEMLLGHHPFHRENFAMTMSAIVNEPPSPFDGIPEEVQVIIYHALAKSPANRYHTCRELLSDLERLRSHLSELGVAWPDTSATTMSTTELERYVVGASAPIGKAVDKKLKLRRWLLSAFTVLAILVTLWSSPLRRWIQGRFAPRPKHIAVLPFDNVGNNPISPAMAEGLVDSLTNKLSNLGVGQESLWVVPASIVRESNIDKPVAALRDLGATFVVKGTIARDGQNVHLTANLINTETLRQVGSVELDDPAEDIARLEEEAVRQLARILNIRADASSLAKDSSVPAAYEAYLKALGYIQRYDKLGNLDLAISELRLALTRDPQFAIGYAELGETYRLKYQQDHDRKWIEEALSNCKQALALDNRLSAVYVTLGRIHNDSGNHDLAVEEFRQALDLDPRNADALNGMAYSQESAGRITDAEAAYKRAVALRPDYWDNYNTLGAFYSRQRRFDDAIAQLKHAVELTPDNTTAYNNLAGTYLSTGRPQDLALAEKALRKSIELGPTYPALANLGYLYLQQKRYAESAEITQRALQLNDKDYVVWENLDWAYRWLGEADKAATAREKARNLLEQAAKSDPRDAKVQAHLACQYGGLKRHGEALTRVEAALALAPDDPDVLANVSETYEKLGDHQRALQYAQLSLQKGYSLDDLRTDPDMQSILSDQELTSKQK